MSHGDVSQPKRHPQIATAFLVVDISMLISFACLIALGNAFAAYCVCGAVASVLPLRDIRIVLAATAHVAPFGAEWLLRHGGAAAMGIVCLPAFIIFAVYSFTWISMLSERASGNIEPRQ